MKVLVIEDHPVDHKLATHVLDEAGFTVRGAWAWDDAKEAIEADRPEVILLDMFLPGTDGLTVLRTLKSDPQTKGIPVVALTCFPERFPDREVMEAGGDGYIVKPISTRDLPFQLAAFMLGGDE